MSTQVEVLPDKTARQSRRLSEGMRYVAGVAALAAAYIAAAKLGQALRYTGSVSAVWPPVGLGIAALYLYGLRWWPGVFLGDLVVNLELLMGDNALPLGSLIGQQIGNMAEIIGGALLLRRLIGRRAQLDRMEQIVGTLAALALATAISATVGTISMLAGDVISIGDVPTFWRTWWLGDLSGGLVVLPLAVVWATNPARAWRRIQTWEAPLLFVGVVAFAGLAFLASATVTYIVFPALIWAAYRFRAPGSTIATAIVAAVTIGVTADNVGPFSRQEIDTRTLATQLFISVAALTTLMLAAVVSERERSTAALEEATRREGELALEERTRIARDLHDSLSQALFSAVLHTRTAQRALSDGDVDPSGPLAQALAAIGELTRTAQNEMRGLIFDLHRDPVHNGLVTALGDYAREAGRPNGPSIVVDGPAERLPLALDVETEMFGIAREALANVVKHAGARTASVRVEVRKDDVVLEIRDDGCGFDPSHRPPGHYGLDSMRGRADEIGAALTVSSAPGAGTVVRVEADRSP